MASFTLFRYAAVKRLYPCSVTGATGLGYSLTFRPFNSEGHSASALLPGLHQFCPALWKPL
jgi:hypothetical protein